MPLDDKICVVFVCVANSCRSQMAEAIAKRLDVDKQFEFFSAGSHPAGMIDSGARQYLESKGHDLSHHRSGGFDEGLPFDEYDYVVTLCAEACATLPKMGSHAKLLEWPLADPSGQVGEGRTHAYRSTYETLQEKIGNLLNEAGVEKRA